MLYPSSTIHTHKVRGFVLNTAYGGWIPRVEEALVCDEAAPHALLGITRGGWEENASSLHGTYQSKLYSF